ncbi:uncharacterized protein AB675_8057 [Cyphellophora attinorum]|uniref:Uncharacterized protein n=1 Tax=Cyphellophora attinorum TaxID=1664694 RepID=A0A0N1HB06_9EURO|nr:uncharacterized protein AB675_8057 [Phialophora attinorum]KPI41347.1 hypothetical protein AB675_8057 [Phialophora attinorum]
MTDPVSVDSLVHSADPMNMANSPRNKQPGSPTNSLLGLPAEVRLRIYDFIIPSSGDFVVDLCAPSRTTVSPPPADIAAVSQPPQKRSILDNLRGRRQRLTADFKHAHGVQLLSVCRELDAEVFPLLSALMVRFHCPKCFKEALQSLNHDEDCNIKWMKNVEVGFEPPPRRDGLYSERMLLHLSLEACRAEVRRIYGRLDLAGQELWSWAQVKEGSGAGSSASSIGSTTHGATTTAGDASMKPKYIIKGWFNTEWSPVLLSDRRYDYMFGNT